MKINTTYAELNARATEIQRFKSQFPTIAQMMASRLGEFENRNSIHLNSMKKRTRDLMAKHICLTEDGSQFDMIREEGKDPQWKYINPENGHEEFKKEFTALMETPCSIIL